MVLLFRLYKTNKKTNKVVLIFWEMNKIIWIVIILDNAVV